MPRERERSFQPGLLEVHSGRRRVQRPSAGNSIGRPLRRVARTALRSSMKLSSLGWPFLGLAVIVLAGYSLNRGVYVGSSIDVSMREGEGKFLYSKSCHYLYLNGVRDISTGSETPSRENAEAISCALLA